jgi:hypothetical protein
MMDDASRRPARQPGSDKAELWIGFTEEICGTCLRFGSAAKLHLLLVIAGGDVMICELVILISVLASLSH